MPKDKRARSVSQERHSSTSPFTYRWPNRDKHPSASSSQNQNKALLSAADIEWEEARCPICMEHPHNAVLLLCASIDKGCHAYMCDTSYRHSNCLDQFRKSFSGQTSSQEKSDKPPETELYCPLCRGLVTGWKVVDAARHYMNAKVRSCSLESCPYSGIYADLRKHARMDHPFLRPALADPARQRDWRRLEQQRDLGDLLSTMRSSLGMDETGSDPGEVDVDDDQDQSLMSANSFASVTLYIFIQFLGTGTPNVLRYFSRTPRSLIGGSQRRGRGQLWGEGFSEDAVPSRGHVSEGAAVDEFVPAPHLQRPRTRIRRRRRRLLDEEEEEEENAP